MVRILLVLSCVTALAAGAVSSQVLDDCGNPVGGGPYGMDAPLGTVLTSFQAPPVGKVAGITMIGDSLHVISYPNVFSGFQVIYEMDPNTGAVKSSVTVAGITSYYGLGYDTRRYEFVITSSSALIARVSLNGTVTTVWPTPSSRPIGVAYDFGRDAYWVPDHTTNNLYLLDARNGNLLVSFAIGSQGLTRLAGCGYSAENDLVYTNGRDQDKGGFIDPNTGRLLFTVTHPGGTNVGQGATVYRRWQAPLSGNWNTGINQTIYSYEMGLPRVECSATVKFGTALQIKWVAARDAGRIYAAAASLGEAGFWLGNRRFPLTLDDLFFLSVRAPAIFVGFAGALDTSGEALGAVAVPNVPVLAGIPLAIAFATLDASAPLGIAAISGPQPVLISR
ncbi:MAG: hypothetical protein JXQ29_01025 [Planctomycetes bacterium]|nr:hypothetical protein [Planctomycetota bacterium]